MAIHYIKEFKTSLKTKNGKYRTLIWGDPVHLLSGPDPQGYCDVRARTVEGRIHQSKLKSRNELLEFYIIDVGQGDGVLIKTPDGKWHLYDAGIMNSAQMTKKGASNFIRWKFLEELEMPQVELENIILSHPDFDHFGGMIDLLNGKLYDGRTFNVKVNNFYHSGMARFQTEPELGNTARGIVPTFPQGNFGVPRKGTFINEIITDSNSIRQARPFKTSNDFATLMKLVLKNIPNVKNLSHLDKYLPGYDEVAFPNFKIKVLGPTLEEFRQGKYGLRSFNSKSKTRNGHSVVLRFDYDRARVLMTGDLNERSQQLLLSYVPEEEFSADVVKGCHHGSEDIYYPFIKAMMARTTVVSSGDNEDYSHPRPVVLGASGFYGREAKILNLRKGTYAKVAPLLYSTELARSTKLGFMKKGKWHNPKTGKVEYLDPNETEIRADSSGYKEMDAMPLATDLIYGLVNIRTDGNHILCATMEEKGGDFDVKVFKAGV